MAASPIHVEQLPVTGRFSLRAAAEFGFGPNDGRPAPFDGALRLAFPVDGGRGYAGALLTQDAPDGPVTVTLELTEAGTEPAALAQVARIVSLDHDGEAWERVGEADPVIGALQDAHPGQRPVLFHSPYEAAAWSIVSARWRTAQAARVRTALAERLGRTFELRGRTLAAFPQPEALLAGLEQQADLLPAVKLERLRGVAEAARGGELEAAALKAAGPERAYERVQRLKGLGPFYAGLVTLRATGFADALLPTAEPRVLNHVARFYGLVGEPPTLQWLTLLAERWRPFRTWATVLIRLAGDRGTAVTP